MSFFHRSINLLSFAAQAVKRTGPIATMRWIQATAQYNLHMSSPQSVQVKPRFLNHPVTLRTTTSDAFVYRQIMIESEYSPALSLGVQNVIDLGANVGLSSAWFLSRLPGSMVLAVEADRTNWMACQNNLLPYKERATAIHAAAWSRTMKLRLCRRSCAADNVVSADECDDELLSVQGLGMPTIIERSGFREVDLLKIDIEGAEEEIFSHNPEVWLESVRNLCIEVHGDSSRRALLAAMSHFRFIHLRSGELDFFLNIQRA